GVREDRDALGYHDVADVDHVADVEVRDIDLDVLGNVLRQRLDVEVAQMVLDHAALLDADRVADLDHRNIHRDLLGAGHGQEVDVDQRVVDVIALDLTGHGQVRLAVHDQVEQHVGTAGGMQHVEHLARVDGQGNCLLIVPVEHRWHAAGGTELPRHTLPVV